MASNSEITQKSFNPSWMNASPLKMPKPNGMHRVSNDDDESHEMMDPIFAKYRYGREDILALVPGKDSKVPPDGLQKCPYFSDRPQLPIILTSLNETEQRLQQNINSSKALSAAHRGGDWQGKDNEISGSNSPQTNNPWTIAGSSRSSGGSSFRSGNNRWTTSNATEGTRTSKPYSGFGRAGYGPQGNISSDKPQSTKSTWRDTTVGNGFKPRQHLKSTSEDSQPRSAEAEQPKSQVADWAGAWRTTENKTNETKPKTGDLHSNGPFQRLNSTENTKIEQTPKESIWSSSSLHNSSSIWTPPSTNETAHETVENNFSHSLDQLKQIESDFNTQRPKVSPVVDDFLSVKSDQWFYLDPQNVQRGPFNTDQMQTWFLSGYFHADLRIMQPGDNSYTPLGDLIKLNGALTPFICANKTQEPSPSPSTNTQQQWTTQNAAVQKPQKNNNVELSFEALKILEAKERMIVEEQRKLQEKEEALRREEMDRAEKNAALIEMQLKLEHQKQAFLEYERQQREKLEKLEMERKLQIQQEELLKRRQAEMELAEQERERQKILIQNEIKQKEEKRRLELLELQRQQEAARLREEAEKAAAAERLREQQAELERRQRIMQEQAELERRQKILQQQQLVAQQQAQQQAQQLAAQQQAQKVLTATKAAPWSATNQSKKATDFAQIQEQERLEAMRRQQVEEERRREFDAQKKATTPQGNGNPWNVVKSTAKPVPIPPAKENQPQQKAASKVVAKPTVQQQPVKEAKPADPLTTWVIQRIKQMGTNVDAEMLASFLLGVESPNEVEDYVMTYFGENKKAKEFHQEFLTKRIELRPRKGKKEDDLSAPAVAAIDASVGNSGVNKAGGKKSKKGKKIDISAVLNFKPVGDANRFNAGEIDVDLPAATRKGKKK